MATGTKATFTIYHEQMHGGFIETLQQETNVFNAASQGTISLRQKASMGDYDRESFFGVVPGLVTRRITIGTAATAAVADLDLPQNERISVKLNRKIGPVGKTMDSFRKISRDPGELSFIIGQEAAKAVAIDMVNSAIRAAVGALSQTTGGQNLILDASVLSPTTIQTAWLIRGLAKAGDSANGIVAWVMHSSSYYALMENQTSVLVSNVAGTVINAGTPVTLNRPVIVTDSPALFTPGQSPDDTAKILGLRVGAVVVDESELDFMHTDVISGQENLIQRFQGESAFNVGVMGFKWDMSAGGENPDDTAVALGTNWDAVVASDKLKGGVVVKVADAS